MCSNSGGVRSSGDDQFAPAQSFERGLDGTLGEAGGVGQCAQTSRDRFPCISRGLAVQIKINEIGRRLSIVPDDIAHQNVDDVIIDWNCFAKPWHKEK